MSPHWFILCKKNKKKERKKKLVESGTHLLLHCPYALGLCWWLVEAVGVARLFLSQPQRFFVKNIHLLGLFSASCFLGNLVGEK